MSCRNEYINEGDHVVMIAYEKGTAFRFKLSPESVARTSPYRWLANGRGVKARVNGKQIQLGRFLIGDSSVKQPVRHRNGDRFDFRLENLVQGNEYRIDGNTVIVLINHKGSIAEAIVSLSDWPRLKEFTWYILEESVAARIDGRNMRIHRYILGLERDDPRVVDHRDHNPLNNVRSNLRVTDWYGNGRNRLKSEKTSNAYKGVHWHKGKGCWGATIKHNYTQIYLGYFDDPVEGARAYNIAARELFGEYAEFNDVPEPFRQPIRREKRNGKDRRESRLGGTRNHPCPVGWLSAG